MIDHRLLKIIKLVVVLIIIGCVVTCNVIVSHHQVLKCKSGKVKEDTHQNSWNVCIHLEYEHMGEVM